MLTENIFIAHPTTDDQIVALKTLVKSLKIKFELKKEKPYNPEFVAKINESRQQFKDGKFSTIPLDDIWK